MGPPDPKEIASNAACDLAQIAADLNRTRADAHHWLDGAEYGVLRHRLERARTRRRSRRR